MEQLLHTLSQTNVRNIHTAKTDLIRKIFGDGVIRFEGACYIFSAFSVFLMPRAVYVYIVCPRMLVHSSEPKCTEIVLVLLI